MHSISRTSQYEKEAAAIASYISIDSLDAALRFFDALEETERFIAQWPFAGTQILSDPNRKMRRISVKRFRKYQILYEADESEVRLLRVIHGSRNLNSLLRRNGS